MDSQEKRNRISNHTAALMFATAVAIDGFQGMLVLIPLAGWLLGSAIGILGTLTFYLWFKFRGVSIGDSAKKVMVWIICWLLEYIPALGELFPGIILSTVLTIIIVRADDVLYNKGIDTHLTTSKKKALSQNELEVEREMQIKLYQESLKQGASDTMYEGFQAKNTA